MKIRTAEQATAFLCGTETMKEYLDRKYAPEKHASKGKANSSKTDSTRATFEDVKRNFEAAYGAGQDYSAELYELATAVTYSVLNKCIDPQRKTAISAGTVSNTGYNTTMVTLKNTLYHNIATLDNTRRCANEATKIAYNDDGDLVTEVVNKDANTALNAIIQENLNDGIDLVQEASVAILEQARIYLDSVESHEREYAEKWLDSPYTVNRLSRRVYVKLSDSAAYREEETTPIQEVYKAVRRAVQDSRAVQTDPGNGYSYIEDLDPNGKELIYYRTGKWLNIGGYDCNDLYTVGKESAESYEAIIEKMNLTARQAQVLQLRMKGYGSKAIATYLGITRTPVKKSLELIQKKAESIGFTPGMWLEMTGENE
jgi:DNA-binding CsgD family transcriptional regulator